jgi:hypothetical protein
MAEANVCVFSLAAKQTTEAYGFVEKQTSNINHIQIATNAINDKILKQTH